MKLFRVLISALLLFSSSRFAFATDRFVSLLGAHQPPFTNWTAAATNIQSAIDVASAGDVVWVTNGIYSTGGKIMGGDLLNRVVLDKAVSVQSINGAAATVIKGVWDTNTNGLSSVRCAWLTNGATLNGFTLRDGATRAWSNSPNEQMNAGGVWAASTNALIFNCTIATNASSGSGGGVYRGTLSNCVLIANSALGNGQPNTGTGSGGGVHSSILKNCTLMSNTANSRGGGSLNTIAVGCVFSKNSSYSAGGAAYNGPLLNCTVIENSTGPFLGGAVANLFLTNCIVVSNFAVGNVATNYLNATSVFSCSSPIFPGVGNISVDPQLLADGFHLSPSSPCLGAGTNIAGLGTDLDGQAWLNPPSIGCDEWFPKPVIGRQPKFEIRGFPAVLNIGSQVLAGQEPFDFTWQKDGLPLPENARFTSVTTSNLIVNTIGPADSGNYQFIASNGSGAVTSAIVKVTIRGVDAASTSPAVPFSDWNTAASNIQDAIDIAEVGDIVLVTNGLYNAGGKVMAGDLTNRVALTKSLTVRSVNGPSATIIQGAWDGNTNGPTAVRCAWLTNGAILNGFTLFGGATRTNGGSTLQSGGGVWGVSTQAQVVSCFIFTNAASLEGGGNFQAALSRCKVIGNRAANGAGSSSGSLRSTLLTQNVASNFGGGVYGGDVNNCTIMDNNAAVTGGMYSISTPPHNSIIFYNNYPSPFSDVEYSGLGGSPNYCCIYTSSGAAWSGTGNIASPPQLTDDLHLAITSPCRGAGSILYSAETDFDGEPWLNPPAIGCDEVFESAINGPLSVQLGKLWEEVVEKQFLYLFSAVTGRVTRATWSFGDGSVLTNLTAMDLTRRWTNTGDYTVTFTAYNTDNTNGVSASTVVHVVPLILPTLSNFNSSGTNFTAEFFPQPSVPYYFERATNLVPPITWQTLATIYGASNFVQVVDPSPTNATRFYRIRIR